MLTAFDMFTYPAVRETPDDYYDAFNRAAQQLAVLKALQSACSQCGDRKAQFCRCERVKPVGVAR